MSGEFRFSIAIGNVRLALQRIRMGTITFDFLMYMAINVTVFRISRHVSVFIERLTIHELNGLDAFENLQ